MANLKNKRRDGKYTIKDKDGTILYYPSATTILRVIDKPALIPWAGGQVYDALLENPDMNRQEALAAIYVKRDKAGNVGSLVHSWAEAVGNGSILNPDDLPKDIQGYGKAFMSFIDSFKPIFIKTEHTVWSKKYGYAGTLDAIAKSPDGIVWLLDFKTSKGADYPEQALQLVAYKNAVEELEEAKIDKQAIVHLKPDGTFGFYEKNGPFNVFLSCLELYKFLNN